VPVTLGLEPGSRLIRFAPSGTLTTAEMTEAVEAVAAHVTELRDWAILSDHRDLETAITPEQLHLVLAMFERRAAALAGARWAIVTRAPASVGMMRALAVRVQGLRMHVEIFGDMADARRWLGLAPGDD